MKLHRLVNVTNYKTRVEITTINHEGKEVKYLLPKIMYYHLKEAYNRVENSLDALFIITGGVGSGKSNLGEGLGGTWENVFFNRDYNLDNVHFSSDEVVKRTELEDNKTECIKFDEAIVGGSSKDGITKTGGVFRKTLVTKRFKRHMYIIITDSLKELNDKLIERATAWYRVEYKRSTKTGKYRKGLFKVFTAKEAVRVYHDLKNRKVRFEDEHPVVISNKILRSCPYFGNIWFSESDYDKKKSHATNLLEEKGNGKNNIEKLRYDLLLIELSNAGVTISDLAKKLQIKYSTLKSRISTAKAEEMQIKEKLLSAVLATT